MFTFALGSKIVVYHSTGRTSDAQLYQPGIFIAKKSQEDVKGHRPEGAILTSSPNDNDGCHSERKRLPSG